MKLPKFKRDDIVETPLGTKCRVKRFYAKDKKHYYEVEIIEGVNKGSSREFEENLLSFHYNMDEGTPKKDNIPPKCPKCGSKWHVSRFGMKKWYDCPKCEDKAENLCKMEQIPPIPQDTNNYLVYPEYKDDLSDFVFDFDDDDIFLKKRKGYQSHEEHIKASFDATKRYDKVNLSKYYNNSSFLSCGRRYGKSGLNEAIQNIFTAPTSGMYKISGKLNLEDDTTIQIPEDLYISKSIIEKKANIYTSPQLVINHNQFLDLKHATDCIFNIYDEFGNIVPNTRENLIKEINEMYENVIKEKNKRQLTDFDLYYIKDEEKL